ncbi:hypothetical protein SGFS_013370 [Streptomyces graminofaciens]|uniref:Uncharacterized protein n=1 Tax=Streptomyces graminofaciens TaxID=68212 RepID=A0ABN5VAY1_9ACTN|nr:hypothetical protein [Streptomyces graminofaciens]BBC30043.1 hypothetical protein SGFS_013370 [Streptomyces graminofaciens]
MNLAAITITSLTRNETYAAIDAAPHGAHVELAITQPDDRHAGRRYDATITGLTVTGARDLINAVHQHMDAVMETGKPPA